jgi:hypothetical protein
VKGCFDCRTELLEYAGRDDISDRSKSIIRDASGKVGQLKSFLR